MLMLLPGSYCCCCDFDCVFVDAGGCVALVPEALNVVAVDAVDVVIAVALCVTPVADV